MDRVVPTATPEQLLAHTAWLTRVARALTITTGDADDVVQETWVRALKSPPVDHRNLRGWLATLARNLVRSRRRSRAREEARVRALERPPVPAGPENAVARAELQQIVLDAVLALAEPYRSTLVLRFLDELSAEEIAKRDDEPVETVRTRIKRGLDQVRARVAGRLGGKSEELPALLAPLLTGGGTVVATGANAAWIVGIAAAVVASVTLVATLARHEGGARDLVTTNAPAAATANDRRQAEHAAAAATATATTASPTTTPAPGDPRGNGQGIAATRELASDATAETSTANRPVTQTFDVVGTVVDSTGTPVAGATVALLDPSAPDLRNVDAIRIVGFEFERILDRNLRSSIRAQTDAKGGFVFTAVDGFPSWRIVAFRRLRDSSKVCDVTSDHSASPVRVLLSLLRSIAVHGRVVGPDGNPAPKAFVNVMAREPGTVSSSAGFMLNCRADSSGAFEVSPLPAASFDLSASCGALVSTPIRRKVSDDEDAVDVTLTLHLPKDSTRLHGRVLDPDETPITDSQEFLSHLAAWEQASSDSTWFVVLQAGPMPSVGAVVTKWYDATPIESKSGEFSFDLTREGGPDTKPTSIAVVARRRVVAVAPLAPEDLLPSEKPHELEDLVVDLEALPPHPVVGAIRVHAIDATSSSPVEILEVDVRSARMDGGAAILRRGSFGQTTVLPGIEPGPTIVRVHSKSYVPEWREIEVVASEEPADVTVPLAAATRAVRGEVIDPAGRPVSDARVWWLERDGDTWRRSALDPAKTDSKGHFTFPSVGDARGAVAIESPSFVPVTIPVAAADRSGVAGELDPITLQRGATVTFRIGAAAAKVDHTLLRIVTPEGACVWQDWSDFPTAWVDGSRRTVTLAPGTYRYSCMVAGFAPVEGEFVATDGGEIVVTPRGR